MIEGRFHRLNEYFYRQKVFAHKLAARFDVQQTILVFSSTKKRPTLFRHTHTQSAIPMNAMEIWYQLPVSPELLGFISTLIA